MGGCDVGQGWGPRISGRRRDGWLAQTAPPFPPNRRLQRRGKSVSAPAHRGDIKVKGALAMALQLVSVVIDPDGWDTNILHLQEAIRIADRVQIKEEPIEAGKGFLQWLQIAGVQIVGVTIETKTDAVIQNWPPIGKVKMAFHHARKTIVSRPTIQENPRGGNALRKCPEVTRRERLFSKGVVNRVHLVPAVAAVLLSFARHPVHNGFLRAVIEGVTVASRSFFMTGSLQEISGWLGHGKIRRRIPISFKVTGRV